jgi:hypothetical protein
LSQFLMINCNVLPNNVMEGVPVVQFFYTNLNNILLSISYVM